MSDAPNQTNQTDQTNQTSQAAGHGEVHVKSYLLVFVALLCLTLVTVGISYLHLQRPQAIALGLTVAAVKASLVAAVFMHLLTEKKVIVMVFGFTFFFFGLVLFLPILTSGGGLANP